MKKLILVTCLAIPLVVVGVRMAIGEDPERSTYRQLLKSMTERERQAVVLGEDHPAVTAIDEEIAKLTESFKIAVAKKSLARKNAEQIPNPSIANIEGLSDAELRKVIQSLASRVSMLENEITELKEYQKPRFELLAQ